MSKEVKGLIVDELKGRYAELDSALWVEFVGVDGITTNQFREQLREKEMSIEIVKTSLFKRAVADGPLDPLAAQMTGPCAVVTGGETLIDVAKVLEDWLPKLDGLKLKGAILEGEYLDEDRVQTLHKMPTKRDLQAKVAAIILSPAGNLAGAMLGPGRQIASCVKTIIEKLEDGEEIKKAG